MLRLLNYQLIDLFLPSFLRNTWILDISLAIEIISLHVMILHELLSILQLRKSKVHKISYLLLVFLNNTHWVARNKTIASCINLNIRSKTEIWSYIHSYINHRRVKIVNTWRNIKGDLLIWCFISRWIFYNCVSVLIVLLHIYHLTKII